MELVDSWVPDGLTEVKKKKSAETSLFSNVSPGEGRVNDFSLFLTDFGFPSVRRKEYWTRREWSSIQGTLVTEKRSYILGGCRVASLTECLHYY